MLQNIPIYLIFMLQLGIAAYLIYHRRRLMPLPYLWFVALVLPAFLLVWVGVEIGIRQLPPHQVVIHGYRVPVTARDASLYVGSDIGSDDLRFHFRVEGRELIDPGILKIVFDGSKGGSGFRLIQTDPYSPNVIKVNGKPLRSLPLEPGVTHRLSFGRFGYSEKPEHLLRVRLRNGRPEFLQGDRVFTKGFSIGILGGLISWPYDEGVERHLAIGGRIRFPRLPISARELLKQASLFRHGGRFWIAANDADMCLDGRDFPVETAAETGATVRIATRQLAAKARELRSAVFRVFAPDGKGVASFQLPNSEKKHFQLGRELTADRLCLTAGESYFSGTYDVIDPQFPLGGAIINREGTGFVFRGQLLQKNKLYSCGKAVFSIDAVPKGAMRAYSWFGILFLAAIWFVPAGLVRKDPLIAVILGAAVFLLAFRQVLAFRAWQGPPYKFSPVMDSLTAPYLFMLVVLLIAIRHRPWRALQFLWIKAHNFFRRGNLKIPPALEVGAHGLWFVGLVVFGFAIYLGFARLIGMRFPGLIILAVGLSFAVILLEMFENRASFLSAAIEGPGRWRPAVFLLVYILGLILVAPLLGGKEVIAILPGRPRPDIFIQVFLLFAVAYFAAVWEGEARRKVPNPWGILMTFVAAIAIPFGQGLLAEDLGFFLMVSLPLFFILLLATYKLDARLNLMWLLCVVILAALPFIIKSDVVSLEHDSLKRVAFFIDKARVKAEYFHTYLAHLPMLWSSDQGFFGGGFFMGDWYPELTETSVNDNVPAVFIQGELGALGTVLCLLVFIQIACAILLFLARNREAGGYRPWFLFGISLMFIWTPAIMFLANLGYFPLTGKNLPLLGIDSLNDILRYGLLTGFAVRYMDLMEEA